MALKHSQDDSLPLEIPRQPHETATSQALRLPYLLRNIFQFLRNHPSRSWEESAPLFHCALVCRLWELEAMPLLWEDCGPPFVEGGNFVRSPEFWQLIARIEPIRRQRYASCIRHLKISSGDPPLAGDYLQSLGELKYPSLEVLVVEAPSYEDDEGPVDFGILMFQFIQPRLRRLRSSVADANAYVVSTKFLNYIQKHAPSLRDMQMTMKGFPTPLDHKYRPSTDEVAALFQSLQLIERICWQLESTISGVTLRAFGSRPHLKVLIIPKILDSWLDDDFPSAQSFPVLEELESTISGLGLLRCLPSLGTIRKLRLTEPEERSADRPGLWSVFMKAQFEGLTALKINVHPDTLVNAGEMLTIARRNPDLHYLWIEVLCIEQPYQLLTSNFSDATVAELAALLPKLKTLFLRCYNAEQGLLSEQSLLSLGRSCTGLEEITLLANINWARVLETNISWPNLSYLSLWNPTAVSTEPADASQTEAARQLGTELLRRVPLMLKHQLTTSLQDTGDWRAVVQAMYADIKEFHGFNYMGPEF